MLDVVAMQNEHIDFVIAVMTSDRNKAALHLGRRTAQAWHEIFVQNLADPDEVNFILHKEVTPVAWLKINGLQSQRAAISMLVVHEAYQRQGIAAFAVRYAEKFAQSQGCADMTIHTTTDNAAAINCYEKLGYAIAETAERTMDDGVKRQCVTFWRSLT
ncbi:MAG: GNAT family N-acetyltransferase [Oscillospiraceae bacterium]|nr:GNAT family N-acetyltransferase [Oscillospiraceae bacterium]